MEKIINFLFFDLPFILIFFIGSICVMWLFKIEFNFIKPITSKLSEDEDCNVMLIFTIFSFLPFILMLVFILNKIFSVKFQLKR